MRLAAILVLLLAGCAAPPSASSPDLRERLWQGTVLTFPADALVPSPPGGEPVSRSVQALDGIDLGGGRRTSAVVPRPGLRRPAVVYLHGCGGPDREADIAAALLARQGWIVARPNHFARPDAVQWCRGGVGPGVGPSRIDAPPPAYAERRVEEARIAVDGLRGLGFVDPARIAIMGHSAGGATVSQWSDADIVGAVAMGYDCNSRISRGVRIPPSVPILFVQDQRDPWLTANQSRRCGEYTAFRANATDLAPRHNDHSVMPYPEVQDAVVRFLSSAFATR